MVKISVARLLNSRSRSRSSRIFYQYSVPRYPNRSFDPASKAIRAPMASTDEPTVDSGIAPASSIVPSPSPASRSGYRPRFIDIGINLTDSSYVGVYHRKKQHRPDLIDVINRAMNAGCKKMMVTGSDLRVSEEAVRLADEYPGVIYATVGVHPCSAKQFDKHPEGPDAYLQKLENLALEGKRKGLVTAFGEVGLDYDRLTLCPKETQLKYFELQLKLSVKLGLPLFLHSRAASQDFFSLLSPYLAELPGGVVHSFTGTLEEMRELIQAGLYIGINGCSLKTVENLAVVKEIPLDRLMLETDGPWCEMRPSHASSKIIAKLIEEGGASVGGPLPELPKQKKKEKWEKNFRISGRNEPVAISHVAWAVASVKGITIEELCEAVWRNSTRVFGLGERLKN